jgi:hypothetical protein
MEGSIQWIFAFTNHAEMNLPSELRGAWSQRAGLPKPAPASFLLGHLRNCSGKQETTMEVGH